MGMKEIREPALAGSWYPGEPGILSRDVKRYLENAKKEKVEGEIVAWFHLTQDTRIQVKSRPLPINSWRGWFSIP